MHTYIYNGSVMQFGRLISDNWSAKTKATSPEKALSNLLFRYKREHGYLPSTGGFKLNPDKLSMYD